MKRGRRVYSVKAVALFGQAAYPVTDPAELIPVLPDGATTTFRADGVTLGAMELGTEYAEYQNYRMRMWTVSSLTS